ncbi:MAG: hypothetical protein AABX90_00255 [Nanoarchaeota archaeon]
MTKIATCIKGLEDIAAKELKGKKVCPGRVSFLSLAKNHKTVNNVYELFKKFNFKELEDIAKKVEKFEINKKITVLCTREGTHNFKSVDVANAVSQKLREIGFITDFKDFKETLIIDVVNNICFIGKLIKRNLCKRDYRVKLAPGTINACLAASVLKLIELKKGEAFLDPLCKDGIIAIEASYITNKVYGFGLDVYAAKINAKIAKKKINFGNYDLDWLSIKFKESSIDKIATYLPTPSKRRQNLTSFYRKFFHHVEYVLKDKLAIICIKPEAIKNIHLDLNLIEERGAFVGNQKYAILIFEKPI